MTDTALATATLAVAVAGLGVLASSRLSERIAVPLPALVLVGGAAVASAGLRPPGEQAVQRIVSLALVAVLFNGGLGLGVGRLRSLLGPVALVGVVGTFTTAAVGTIAVHLVLGTSWYASALVATALAPTDPTVVFSVLGRRRIAGVAGTLLEAESGANDPVGIALMAALVGAHSLSGSGAASAAATFGLQMAVGLAVGGAGGWLLRTVVRRQLPDEGLHPLRTLAFAYALFGLASLAHGSGFLAVFVAGIAVADVPAPYAREVGRFHGALASLGEAVAFAVLGLTVHLPTVSRVGVWLPGVGLGLLFALVVRPLAVGPLLQPVTGARSERAFVVLAGLKGAVPILLAGDLLVARLPGVDRLYAVVVVAVAVSVVVQGGTIGVLARRLGLEVSDRGPEPWAVGVRLPEAPQHVLRCDVQAGSAADGTPVGRLRGLEPGARISLLVRDGRLVAVHGDTRLQVGDDLTLVGVDPERADATRALFTAPARGR